MKGRKDLNFVRPIIHTEVQKYTHEMFYDDHDSFLEENKSDKEKILLIESLLIKRLKKLPRDSNKTDVSSLDL